MSGPLCKMMQSAEDALWGLCIPHQRIWTPAQLQTLLRSLASVLNPESPSKAHSRPLFKEKSRPPSTVKSGAPFNVRVLDSLFFPYHSWVFLFGYFPIVVKLIWLLLAAVLVFLINSHVFKCPEFPLSLSFRSLILYFVLPVFNV